MTEEAEGEVENKLLDENNTTSISIGSKIRILTYNFYLRPPFINENWDDYKDHRLKIFIKSALPNYDLIVFQEVFSFASWRITKLIQAAYDLGYKYHRCSPRKNIFSDWCVDGGLLLISKYEILESDNIEYGRGTHSDALAAKGAIYAKIKININGDDDDDDEEEEEGNIIIDQLPHSGINTNSIKINNNSNNNNKVDKDRDNHIIINLLTTHMQASPHLNASCDDTCGMLRLNQIEQISKFMKTKSLASDCSIWPWLVLGDFNIDAKHYENCKDNHCSENEYMRMMNVLKNGIGDKYDISDLLLEIHDGIHPVTYGDGPTIENPNIIHEKTISKLTDISSFQCLDYILWSEPIFKSNVPRTSSFPPDGSSPRSVSARYPSPKPGDINDNNYKDSPSLSSVSKSNLCSSSLLSGSLVIEGNESGVNKFHIANDKYITHLSDHYGAQLTLKYI
jgi:hypothetical protein